MTTKGKKPDMVRICQQAQDIVKEYFDFIGARLAEAEADKICGSWVKTGGLYMLLIRKCDQGYSAMLCNNSPLLKTIAGEFQIVAVDGMLSIMDDVADCDDSVSYNARRHMLHFGRFGEFLPEETVIRNAAADQALAMVPDDYSIE